MAALDSKEEIQSYKAELDSLTQLRLVLMVMNLGVGPASPEPCIAEIESNYLSSEIPDQDAVTEAMKYVEGCEISYAVWKVGFSMLEE